MLLLLPGRCPRFYVRCFFLLFSNILLSNCRILYMIFVALSRFPLTFFLFFTIFTPTISYISYSISFCFNNILLTMLNVLMEQFYLLFNVLFNFLYFIIWLGNIVFIFGSTFLGKIRKRFFFVFFFKNLVFLVGTVLVRFWTRSRE